MIDKNKIHRECSRSGEDETMAAYCGRLSKFRRFTKKMIYAIFDDFDSSDISESFFDADLDSDLGSVFANEYVFEAEDEAERESEVSRIVESLPRNPFVDGKRREMTELTLTVENDNPRKCHLYVKITISPCRPMQPRDTPETHRRKPLPKIP